MMMRHDTRMVASVAAMFRWCPEQQRTPAVDAKRRQQADLVMKSETAKRSSVVLLSFLDNLLNGQRVPKRISS